VYPGFYWGLREFRSWLKLKDWRQLVAFADFMNRTGLDFITTFKMIGFLAKMYNKGVISTEDTGGFEIKMGDFDDYIRMAHKIMDKEDIFGIAAEGWYPVGRVVGMDKLDDFKDGLPVLKGGDILQDARFSRLTPNTLGCITFSKPQHTHNPTYYYPDASTYHGHDPKEVEPLLMTFDLIKWHFSNRMATTRAEFERTFTKDSLNIGRMAKHCEDCKGAYNSLGICDLSPYGTKDPTQDLPFLAQVYSAATGIDMTAERLKKAGERVWNFNKIINVREGFNREDDRWPTQYLDNTEIPIKLRSGPSYLIDWFGKRLKREDLPKILDDYYEERGWDIETGIPSKAKIQELGLEEFILKLEGFE
jgi:aldehyde:ferredoxin oxidoreductase